MLNHRGVRTLHGQFQRAVRFLTNWKANSLRRGHSGIARAHDFVPAADDRALHKTEFPERGTADIGH